MRSESTVSRPSRAAGAGSFFAMLILLLLPARPLAAADINATIADGTPATYEKLLKTLPRKDVSKDDAALQKTFLQKLVTLSKTPPMDAIEIRTPATAEEFRSLIILFGNWSLSRAEIGKELADIDRKLDTVSDQIRHGGDGRSLFTLQLQYAFYLKEKARYRQRLARYTDAIRRAPSHFADAAKRLRFDSDTLRRELRRNTEDLARLEKKIRRLDLERERLNLLDESPAVKKIDDRLALLHAERKNLLNDRMIILFTLFSAALHRHDADAAFARQEQMTEIADSFYPPEVRRDIGMLVTKMESSILGRMETLRGATVEEVKAAVSLFWKEANAPLFSINGTAISTFKLLLALFIFTLGLFLGGFYKKSIKRLTVGDKALTAPTRTLLSNLGYYFIIIVAFFIALDSVGINLSSIALVAGALSVGIGFGLQNIVSNFVSGIILMFERSIKIGDYVEFDENLRGHVSDIRMRSTTITTNDNIDVIVPNQELIQNRVINWTMNDRIRRFRIPFGVAYGTDVHRVADVVLAAVKKSGYGDIVESGHRRTQVIMTGMGDSSVDFELFVWITGEQTLYPRRTRSRFFVLIYDALNAAGIEIPFPQRDLHIRSVDGEIPLRLRTENDPDQGGS